MIIIIIIIIIDNIIRCIIIIIIIIITITTIIDTICYGSRAHYGAPRQDERRIGQLALDK